LAMAGSFALGAAAVQSLHAQATPPGYAIIEVNVTDKEGYTKESVYMEMVKSREGDVNDMTLATLHDIRMATLV
jgi:hypothetical protein